MNKLWILNQLQLKLQKLFKRREKLTSIMPTEISTELTDSSCHLSNYKELIQSEDLIKMDRDHLAIFSKFGYAFVCLTRTSQKWCPHLFHFLDAYLHKLYKLFTTVKKPKIWLTQAIWQENSISDPLGWFGILWLSIFGYFNNQ